MPAKKLKTGDLVKIARNGERFWLQIKKITPKEILAKVDNDVTEQTFHYGDIIKIKKKEIILILDG
jgi:hypothetical protein